MNCKLFLSAFFLFSTIFSSFAQNVGIGTTTPQYPLDVNGRIRIKHANGLKAGIWFDGINTPTRSFIGTMDDNHVGIFGNAGAGWSLVVNVLDGIMSYRSGTAQPGSQLLSTDADGNMDWQSPISFAVSGLVDGADVTTNQTKLNFNSVPDYNYGFSYIPGTSSMQVTVKGVYHLDASVNCSFGGHTNESGSLMLIRKRNAVTQTLLIKTNAYNNLQVSSLQYPCTASGDFLLEVGDIITVEFQSTWACKIYGAATETRFSGRLVQRIY
jgi:hypothetical protein